MLWVILFIILNLAITCSQASNASEEEITHPTHSSYFCEKITTELEVMLEEFSRTLCDAAQRQDPLNPQDAFYIESQYENFCAFDFPEEEWEVMASKFNAPKWASYTTWKATVGGQLFLNAGIDLPHQNLLRNGLRSLLNWEVDESFTFDSAYNEAVENVHQIIRTHPYLRRRVALYALAASSRCQHPLARFFLTEALACFYEDYQSTKIYAEDQQHNKSFSSKTAEFLDNNHRLTKIIVRQVPVVLQQFINVPGIEDFQDLEGEDLHNLTKLQEKAALGLPHYNKLLGDYYKDPNRSIILYEDTTIVLAIAQHLRAGQIGDFEGYDNASYLISGALSCKKIYPSEIRSHQYALAHLYKFLAALYGSEHAYRDARAGGEMNKRGIEGTSKKILQEFRHLLTQRSIKK